jgi:hypothetical protein
MKSQSQRLDLDMDPAGHRTEWRIQRVGWAVWGMIIVAGLCGVLGSGPLSATTSLATDGSIEVEYDRFVHYHDPITVTVRFRALETRSDRVNLTLSQLFIDRIRMDRIEPRPQQEQLAADGVIYGFEQVNDERELVIHFHFQHETVGMAEGQFAQVGHVPVAFSQLVYP